MSTFSVNYIISLMNTELLYNPPVRPHFKCGDMMMDDKNIREVNKPLNNLKIDDYRHITQ